MANINSNVIQLRTVKQVLFDGSETWNYNTRTFTINVRNESDVILSLNTSTSGSSSARDITIRGKVNLSDSGDILSGIRTNGAIYEKEMSKFPRGEHDIYFDVTHYNYITVSATLTPNDVIKAAISKGDKPQQERGQLNSMSVIKLKVTASYFRLRSQNTYPYSSSFTIKGLDFEGNEVEKTLFSPTDNEYKSTTLHVPDRKSDSFVDVSNLEYVIIETTGSFRYNYSFFSDVEEEYTNHKAENLGGAVRGFEYVSISPSGDFPLWSSRNNQRKEVEMYTMGGEIVAGVNMNVKEGDMYVADVTHSETLVTGGGGFRNMKPVFGFKPPRFIPYIRQGEVEIKKLNRRRPIAQYGRCKAWLSVQNQSLEITYTGRDYGNCEHSVLLSDINPDNPTLVTSVFIPYNRSNTSSGDSVRLCLQFIDGSIYHNFPNRSTSGQGTVQEGDEARFDKSVIWDYENRFPSTDPNATEPYYYDPTLEADNYDPFVPLNESNPYGNGGFPISRDNRARFRKTDYQDALRSLNGFEIDKIYTACDTYRSKTKNGYLETADGGREWFLQAPLGAGIPREKTRGPIDTSGLAAFTGDVELVRRATNHPSEANKDPATKFTLTTIGDVTDIENANNPDITIPSHGLSTGEKVYFTGNSSSHGFMLNNSHTEDSHGNGQVYWVSEVVDSNTIKIEPVAAYTDTNVECRHVHSINRVHDGWVMACGEEYPNGWIIFIKQHLRDFTTTGNPWVKRSFTRLTSAENSVQRAVGFTILDNSNTDPTCLWSVDTSNLPMPILKVGDRETFSRGVNGLRAGKFSDLDDYTQFETIVEFDDAMLGLKRWMDILYAIGGYGQTFAVSVDGGKTFMKGKWDIGTLTEVAGYTENNAVLLSNGYIIDRK